MIDIKSFSGRLNSDDSNFNLLSSDVKMARNVVARGTVPNLRYENALGNVLIPNNNLPLGNNECIGSFYDSLKQRVIWFNWNSDSKHGIYKYDLITETISPLLICFTDSQTDILNFDLDYPIASVNIIYTTDEDGDLICWTDRNSRPKILNILSAENSLYGSDWLEEYLDVAKAPFFIPMKCAYENDATVTINNLRKKLFIGKYRAVYGDNLKSVWSAWGKMPIPFNYTDTTVNSDQTKNSRIRCVIQTGSSDVKKLEIAFAELGGIAGSEGTQWSDFFSVAVLDKEELSIPDNDVYVYDFYNNEAYPFVDVKESLLPFDYVPDKANTQELLNGNIIIYGGILEGKNPVVPSVAVTTSSELPLVQNISSILSVTQAGVNGFSTGNVKFIVAGNIRIGDVYSAKILVGVTTYTITYTAILGDTPALVLAGLSSNATGQGFTQVSISSNTLVISRAGQILLNSYLQGVNQTIAGAFVINNSTKVITFTNGAAYVNLFFKGVQFWLGASTNTIITVVTAVVAGADLTITFTGTVTTQSISDTLSFVPLLNSSIPAYPPNSKYNFGVVYFDEKGKTDGVITAIEFNANFPTFTTAINLTRIDYYIPYLNLSISNRPPLWAKYFHIVRTDNLSKYKYLYWMTDRTYKDEKFAYISIESIQAYGKLNKSSIIGYDFAQGDRIKFNVLFNADSTPATSYGNVNDYEIVEQVISPNINGVVRNGQFLKINLPTTSATFDFSNGISKTYCYYLIELYTPAKSAGAKFDLYSEFGEEYAIGNPGTSLAYHQGQTQNQTEDLVTPATFKFVNGDNYFRRREINVGDVISYDLGAKLIEPNFILEQKITSQSLPNPDYILAESVAYQQLLGTGGFYNNAGWTVNNLTSAYTFLVKGLINLTANVTTAGNIRFLVRVATSANVVVDYELGSQTGATAGDNIQFVPNVNVVFPVNSKAFVYMTCSDSAFRANLISGSLNWAEASKAFQISVFDQNFSDFYISKVSSNGRSFGVNPDEKEIFFQTLLRWGLSYQQNTNINQINRFYPTNLDEVDRSKGSIQRFKTRDRILRVFQNRGVGQYGVYTTFVQSNNSQLVTTTNEILTKGNINYYQGTYGLGEQYCGLISSKNSDYLKDPVRGYDVRLSNDGMTPISELYKGQFFIQPLFPPYNKNYIRANGSKAKIIGAYNYAEEECINVLQSGTLNGDSILPHTFTWNEKRNSYCSFFDFVNCDWITSGENNIFTWKNGQLYIHNNTSKYCNYYGVQYYPSVNVVFNDKVSVRKTFDSISYQANERWISPANGDIFTSEYNEQTNLQQISSLKIPDYKPRGNYFDAALLRDANSLSDSRLALVEGDFLEGQWIEVKFTFIGDKFVFLYMPYLNWQLNNRNF